ncbi:FadR family transcriptional regulator [Mucilaginibacter sp. RS28]|uniref:FadR family transcriptional regulator n=1 Tax=Mucilaginibacter straminoryzae TaxID=2932774 RepID=A0A9X1X134_9SPHI|nr:FadR/GntR family transcriptional regulator [Mucilaginibacter straminoryzae]MCJ8209214.1 FadR family transcriptional regulator [Mucilaginibacter straminoryzae]
MAAKEKLSEKVVRQIREEITAGNFKVNEKIPSEPELMERYSVGRSTIREAIKSLADSGILRVQQGAGTFVNAFSALESIDQRLKRADFEHINAVRKLLENEIVTLAAEHQSEQHLKEIEDYLLQRKQAILNEQRQACIDADIAFHLAIAHASLNPVLADLYQSFTVIIRDFFSKREAQGIAHFAMSHYLHEALYNAIKNKNVEQARQITKEILDHNY